MGRAKSKLLSGVVLIVFVSAGFSGLATSSVLMAHPARDGTAAAHPRHLPRYTATTSKNWAGYAVKTATGAVSDVKANWNVPQIAAACPTGNRYSSFWVGIDGDGSSTVEQIGTETDCSGGFPRLLGLVRVLSKSAPHDLDGHLTGQSHDGRGEVFDDHETVHRLLEGRIDGQVILQVDLHGLREARLRRIDRRGPLELDGSPLTDFGWVTFNGSMATISGATHSISGFSNLAITMWNLKGTAKMATVES